MSDDVRSGEERARLLVDSLADAALEAGHAAEDAGEMDRARLLYAQASALVSARDAIEALSRKGGPE